MEEQGLADAALPDVEGDAVEDTGVDVAEEQPQDAMPQDSGLDASFTPSDLGSLVVWLRSDRGLNISNGKIAAWGDQSNNANDAVQPVASNQPVYNAATPSVNNQATLSFTAASGTFLRIADKVSLQPNSISVALVARYTAQNAYQAMISRTTSGNWNDGWGMTNGPVANNGQVEFWMNSYTVSNSLAIRPIGTWHLWVGTYDGAAVTLYVDGNNQTPTPATGNITYPATTDTLIGAYWGVGSATPQGFANIDLAEVVIYGRALASAEVAEIHAYAVARYTTP